MYDSLKTAFDITKTAVSTSNKAKIALYNLSINSRLAFQKKGLQIQLQAGYQGLIETLYLGDVVRVESLRHGADVVTMFECGDAEKQLYQNVFKQSYPAGTTYVQVVQDLAAALGVHIGPVLGIQQQTYNKGISFCGGVKTILDTMLRGQGLSWSVQNGYLQIVPVKHHNGQEAIVLSKDSGLIGVPSQKESGIQFIALLNPKLMPESPVQIVSETINGFFKIRLAHFEGDSHGDKWTATCEGVPIAVSQELPANNGDVFNTSGTA